MDRLYSFSCRLTFIKPVRLSSGGSHLTALSWMSLEDGAEGWEGWSRHWVKWREVWGGRAGEDSEENSFSRLKESTEKYCFYSGLGYMYMHGTHIYKYYVELFWLSSKYQFPRVSSSYLQVGGFERVVLLFVIFNVFVKMYWLCSQNSISLHFDWPVSEAQAHTMVKNLVKFQIH